MSFEILRFEVTLATPVSATKGWVSIVGTGDDDCKALWLTSPDGNGLHFVFRDVPTNSLDADDLAICFLGTGTTGEGEGPEDGIQTADKNAQLVIDIDELLRVIQLYNSLEYYCAGVGEESEDGYLPGPGANRTCSPFDTDYAPQDWSISLDELLRAIQFYNFLGYHYCPAEFTEDGFCPRRRSANHDAIPMH